ncbi:MAG: ABC transporter substrate-binding protein [Rubrivivax sp.]
MIRRVLAAFVLSAIAVAAPAQTLRWASQGDPQTMDPHSQNEGLTNAMNGQIYEGLIGRGKNLELVPALATEWKQTGPLTWRFKLRPNVKFHDGSTMTADDVVFSIQRAKELTSQINVYANAVGTPTVIDPSTVEFTMTKVNPIFLEHIAQPLWIMSKAWCEKNKVTKPLDFKNKEESFASFNANGTGPYLLVSRAPGIKSVYKRNPNWWGTFDGNVQEIVYTQISNDATRLAALVSGEIDFVLDPAPRDIPRLRSTAGVKIIDGPENRIVFIGMDQARDKLLHGKVPGDKNPFKDVRVRRALYHAIDVETMKTKLMNGQSFPTGGVTPSPQGSYNDPQIESRLPFDLAKARALMAEAGYANGFEITLDCPNNRYINDEEICITLATMWAKIGIKVKVNAMPRATYFAKLDKLDTSMYMLGWGGAVTDAETTMTPVLRNRGEKGVGYYNYGDARDDAFDALAAKSSVEADPVKRKELVIAALREYTSQAHILPLHRQVIPWAARTNVEAVHRADNWLEVGWIKLK